MSEDGDAGSKLRTLGWHQGAVIEVPPGSQLAELLGDEAYAVVVSQDCDVVALVSTEACVDLIPATVPETAAGDLRYGKNPRRLCVELTNGKFANLDIRRRRTVQKADVVGIAPTAQPCVPKDRKLLAKWLGKRYSRPAFPDEFNVRLDGQKKKLSKLSKREEGKHITAIFLSLNTEEELADGEDYKVLVWLACRTEAAGDPQRRAPLEKYAKELADAVDACDGIEVAEYELRAEFDVSLEDLRDMKRYDFDYRSEAPKPGGEKVETHE